MTLDPEVFEQAAKMIERDGWWGGAARDTKGDSPVCISNAVARLSQGDGHYQHALMAYLDVDTMSQLFALNDRQDSRDGKRWAIENLRGVARELREGQ